MAEKLSQEEINRQDIDDLKKDVRDILISVKVIEVKVNCGASMFKEMAKWGIMICTAITSGIFGHKFIN